MLLDATTDALEIILDKAITTNQLSFAVFFNEYTSTTVTPTSNYGTTNSTTAVNLISSPASGKQRQLRWCSINNVDTKDVGVKIRFNANGSYRNVLYIFLRVNESIQYSEEMGWRVYTANGEEKMAGYNKLPSSIRVPEFLAPGSTGTSNIALTTGNCFCIYLGRAERPFSSVKVQYNVAVGGTLLGNAGNWAELAIYRGTPTLGSGTTMTRLGYTDTSSVWNSTGNKTTTVTTSNVAIGDDLWVVFSNKTGGTVTSILSLGTTTGSSGIDGTGGGFFQQVTGSVQPSANSSITGTVNITTNMLGIAWQGVYQGT